MKKVVIICFLVIGVVVVIATLSSSIRQPATPNRDYASDPTNVPDTRQAPRVPAHYKDVASARPLKATLDPELFLGKTRQAYQVAREIPETLAQLPCYCYCDQGFGHKSLHTCYEDDHSAHCSTCVDEALMAYQLQKEQNLAPAQIRDRIIEEFSR
jgi:hypothetical protein